MHAPWWPPCCYGWGGPGLAVAHRRTAGTPHARGPGRWRGRPACPLGQRPIGTARDALRRRPAAPRRPLAARLEHFDPAADGSRTCGQGEMSSTSQAGWSVCCIGVLCPTLNVRLVVAMTCWTWLSPLRDHPDGTQSWTSGRPPYLRLRSPATMLGRVTPSCDHRAGMTPLIMYRH